MATTANLAPALAVCCVLLVGLSAGLVGAGSTVGAADSPTITFEEPSTTVESTTSADLVVETVPDDGTGVGAYEIEFSYDPSVVSISTGDSARFSVETSASQGSDRNTVTLVGYTGETSATTGTLTLAAVDVTPEGNADSTTLRIESVETFTDVDGDPIPHGTAEASFAVSSGSDDDSSGGGLPGGGGGTDDDDDDTAENDTTDDETGDEQTDDGDTDDEQTDGDDTDETGEDDTTDDEDTGDGDGDGDGGGGGSSIPGFGIGAAVAALLAGLGLARRRAIG